VVIGITDTRAQYDHLGGIYLGIAIAVFAVVALTLAAFLWRYRAGRRPGPGGRTDSTRLEAGYAVGLALIAAFLVALTFRVESRVDAITSSAEAAGGPVRIGVVAAQWNWRFVYPGRPRVEVLSGDTGRREFVVPAGRRILFRGASQDVLHDFWIPDLRFQRQVWPDHTESWALVFPHPGRYQGLCAWFCGLDHERMDFVVRAVVPDQYDAWLAARRREAAG
jgi:cytochrome c oxidase subunit 2